MWLITAIPVIALMGLVFTLIRAINGNKNWLWGTGIFTYLLSFMGIFTLGTFTMPFAFMFWTVAFAYLLKRINGKLSLISAGIIGLTIGVICIVYFKSEVFAPMSFILVKR